MPRPRGVPEPEAFEDFDPATSPPPLPGVLSRRLGTGCGRLERFSKGSTTHRVAGAGAQCHLIFL